MSRKITPNEYQSLVSKESNRTDGSATRIKSFLIGGTICMLGEGIRQLLLYFEVEPDAAAAWTSVILVFCSAVFTGLGLYEKLAKHGGAGTLVPITGFANAVASAAVESRTEGYILGVGAKIFTIAGPVILYGTTASVLYGIIYYLFCR